jgi:hypothetical protein
VYNEGYNFACSLPNLSSLPKSSAGITEEARLWHNKWKFQSYVLAKNKKLEIEGCNMDQFLDA